MELWACNSHCVKLEAAQKCNNETLGDGVELNIFLWRKGVVVEEANNKMNVICSFTQMKADWPNI